MMKPSTENKTVLKSRFVLEEVLGQGGMGTVYKALDLLAQEARDKDPYLAIKLLNSDLLDDPVFFIAMQREAKKAKTLAHPNIITIYDFDRDGNHVYLSMELLKGQPLSALIKQHPDGMSFSKAWPLIQSMAAALSHAHRNGIVHSDFKPGNVFVDEQGRVKVLDFGIASRFEKPGQKSDDTTIFSPRTLQAYSPPYASLEKLNNQASHPGDDIYALACVVYELLTGKHPFSRSSAQQAYDLKAKPAPIATITKAQWNGLLHGLALKLEDRTKSIDQFLQEISPIQQSRIHRVIAITAVVMVFSAVSGWFLYHPAKTGEDFSEEPKPPGLTTQSIDSVPNAGEPPAKQAAGENVNPVIQPLKLRLSAPRYKIGEAMSVFVASEKPLYVTIVHINAKGETSTIFPNDYETDHLIHPGAEIRIPKSDADYEFTVSGPAGTDRIEAFGSAKPLPKAGDILGPNGKINPAIEALIAARATLEVPVD